MKLSVKNLGRIESADLDIKPLTVFFGPNGTNKTWLAATLFAHLRSCSRRPVPPDSASPQAAPGMHSPALHAGVSRIAEAFNTESPLESIGVAFDLHSALEESPLTHFVAPEIIRKYCGVDIKVLPKPSSELTIATSDARQRLPHFTLTFSPTHNRLEIARLRSGWVTKSRFSGKWTRTGIFDTIMQHICSPFESVIFLPADRSGLATTFNMLDTLETRWLPAPADIFVSDLDRLRHEPRGVNKVAIDVESAPIFGGRVVVGDDDAREIGFDVGNGLTLPIAAAASVARANAALLLHLRRSPSMDDVILIDELELNAHPKAQLALVELMATLVNAGIRVVFTTHSPYVVDHLNNLLVAGRLPEAKHEEAEKLLTLGSRQAFLSTNDVAAYRFVEDGEKVRVEDAIDPDEGQIFDATFAGATDKVMNLYGDLRDLEDRE